MSDSSKYRIDVDAVAQYLPDQSEPDDARFVFAYHITITNRGDVAAQLISRHWVITDGNGEVQEVRGVGVVGEQPFLRPGDHFRYTSGAGLPTPVGSMRGEYLMRAEDGTEFDADIAPFVLAVPGALH